MPTAYLVAVAEGSSLDRDTGNLTLFKLLEQLQVVPEARFPAVVPYEVHSCWEFADAERGQTYEARMVTDGAFRMASEPISFRAEKSRMRLRMSGLGLPSLGQVRVTVEIRPGGGSTWLSSGISWPLLVEQAPSVGELAADAAAAAAGR